MGLLDYSQWRWHEQGAFPDVSLCTKDFTVVKEKNSEPRTQDSRTNKVGGSRRLIADPGVPVPPIFPDAVASPRAALLLHSEFLGPWVLEFLSS